jgi:hypothetical protein
LAADFTNVRRYQLGIPVWRALGGLTQIELEAVACVHEKWTARRCSSTRGILKNSRSGRCQRTVSVPARGLEPGKDVGEVKRAKDDAQLAGAAAVLALR